MAVYEVIPNSLEMPAGTRFRCLSRPVESGALCLIRVGKIVLMGRWLPNVAGHDWIIQPGRIIRIVGNAIVEMIGLGISVLA